MIAQEVVLQCFVPKDDVELIRAIGKPLAGEVIDSPLVGTEIAVVSMSLEIHHLPHPSCDIAEYVRRLGAKSNMVGMARGVGKRIAGINDEERDVINEHDIAVFLLGNFETCIEHKMPVMLRGIDVPVVLCGGPDKEVLERIVEPKVDGYVGNVGRFMHRTKESEELTKLDEIIAEITRVLEKRREEIAKDPLSVSPARLMDVHPGAGAGDFERHVADPADGADVRPQGETAVRHLRGGAPEDRDRRRDNDWRYRGYRALTHAGLHHFEGQAVFGDEYGDIGV